MSSDHSASRSSVGAAGAVWVLLGQCECYWGSVGAAGAVWQDQARTCRARPLNRFGKTARAELSIKTRPLLYSTIFSCI